MALAESKPEEQQPPKRRHLHLGWGIRIRLPHPHILALILVVGIVVTAYVVYRLVGDWRALGYPGAFLASLIGSASLVVPIPGIAVVFTLGGILNPWVVGLFAGLGMAIGELTGYLAGYSGEVVLHRLRFYDRVEGWLRRHGGILIFVVAAIPNPFFDVIGAVAGAFRYPVWKFFLLCWGGETIKGTLYALAGAWGLHYILDLWAKGVP